MLSFRCYERKSEQHLSAGNPGAAFYRDVAFIQVESHTPPIDFDDGNDSRVHPFLDRFRVNAISSSNFFLRDQLCTHDTSSANLSKCAGKKMPTFITR
jgi:hypothetical protein